MTKKFYFEATFCLGRECEREFTDASHVHLFDEHQR
jgi:hypothetical protein